MRVSFGLGRRAVRVISNSKVGLAMHSLKALAIGCAIESRPRPARDGEYGEQDVRDEHRSLECVFAAGIRENRSREAVARLESRLNKVSNRRQAIAALQTLDKFRLALLRDALNLNGNNISGNFAFVNSGEMDWVDPVIAARMTHDLGNGRSITAMGNVGGFDTASDFSWRVLLTYDIDGKFLGFDTTPPSATRRSACSRRAPAMATAASTWWCCTAPSPS
jgi:hypothetical protein